MGMSKMTMGNERTGFEGRGQPRTTGAAAGHATPLNESAAKPAAASSGGPGRLLMVGVFLLSALVGGGAAGLFLAMNEQQKAASESEAGIADAETAATVAALEQAVQEGDSGAAIAATQAKPAVTAMVAPAANPTEVQGGDAVRETAVQEASPVKKVAAVVASERIAAAQAGPEMEQLRAMTDQVVAALGGMVAPQPAVGASASIEELQARLARIVDAALAEGKSDDQIRQLVEEALSGVDEDKIPAVLRGASKKIDLRRLLATILPNEKAVSANLDGETKVYFRQLTVEAKRTVTDERGLRARDRNGLRSKSKTASKRKSRPYVQKAAVKTRTNKTRAKSGNRKRVKNRSRNRFFFRNGKRYTIVRKGDTLKSIASAAYGDRSAYRSILRANRGRIGKQLRPGTRILIPNIKAAKRQKRRKRQRQSGVPGRQEVLLGYRSSKSASKITPAGARATSYRMVSEKGVKITNFRPRKKARAGQPIVLYADAL